MVLAERLRETVQNFETRLDGCTIPITASFGVSGFSAQGEKKAVKPQAFLQQVDILLYEAKAAGRNQVIGRPLLDP